MATELERVHVCHVGYTTDENDKLSGLWYEQSPKNTTLSLSVSRIPVDLVGTQVDLYNFFLYDYEEQRGTLFGLGLYKMVNGALAMVSGNNTTNAMGDLSPTLEQIFKESDRWGMLDYNAETLITERTRHQRDIVRLAKLAGYMEGRWVYRTGEEQPVYRINDETFDPYNDRTITWQLIARLKIDVSHKSDRMVFTRSDINVSREVLNMHRCDMGSVICELALKKGK